MDYVMTVLFGLLSGVAEFMPLSLSSHVVLFGKLFPLDQGAQLIFLAWVELMMAIATIVYFRKDIFVLVQAVIRKLGRLPTNDKDLTTALALLTSGALAVVVTLLFRVFLYTEDVAVIAVTLSLGAIFYMYAEWRYYQNPPQSSLTIKRGLIMSALTIFALVPGFSSMGIILAVGMLLGLSRLEATRFALLLSIPILITLGITDLFKIIMNGGGNDGGVSSVQIVLLCIVTFIISLWAIQYVLAWMRKHTLWPFIWYNLIVATFAGYLAFFL